MPPPQRKEIGRESSRGRDVFGSIGERVEWRRKSRRLWITECCRWRTCPPLSCLLFLVLFVFVSCVVPLSTPSSTQVSTSATTLFGNASFPNTTLFTTSSSSSAADESALCPTAKLWIKTRGSFCFTLRDSPFLKNATELSAREERAIAMFCELDFILEKVDCAQPYSVNVDRRQCWLCREAYRDWACAMSADTLEDGRVDCEGGVMPCPSCASICHQVMRLCPYLTPDRVQFDETGDATAHVSQYGGHPAFYCPLENIRASDPAYSSDCNAQYASYDDPDYVHNLCAADARFMSKRSAAVKTLGYIPHYSTCCWTYASSLVEFSGLFEKNIREHGTGYYRNRVILNCCDSSGKCDPSDPEGALAEEDDEENEDDDDERNSSSRTPSTERPPLVRELGSTLRTANNQVRGEDGKFMELKNLRAYMQDSPLDEDEEEDDEEYYDDSGTGEIYSGSSNEQTRAPYRRRYLDESSSSVISIHRDNKIYVTRESRSVHDTTFYLENNNERVSSSGSAAIRNTLSCLISALIPPLVMLCCVNVHCPHASLLSYYCLRFCERFEHVISVCVFSIVVVGGDSSTSQTRRAAAADAAGGGQVLVSPVATTTTTTTTERLDKYRTFECCEALLLLRACSSKPSQLINLPIKLRYSNKKLSHRKLVVKLSVIVIILYSHT